MGAPLVAHGDERVRQVATPQEFPSSVIERLTDGAEKGLTEVDTVGAVASRVGSDDEFDNGHGVSFAQSLFERLISGRIVESVGGHEAGEAGEAACGDVEATGALALKAAPVAEPAEGPLDDPAALQHHEALLPRVLLDDAAAHAV